MERASENGEIRALIKKKKAGVLTSLELDRLIELLEKLIRYEDLAPGIKVAAGVVLANLIVKRTPKQLAA